MTYEYEWTRENLKEVLVKKRKKTTIITLIVGTIFYFYLTYFGFMHNYFDNIKLILGFFIYLAVIYLVLLLINFLYIRINLRRNDKRTNKAYGKYIIRMNDKQIESDFNDQKIVYKWEDISKLKVRKNYFFIRTKNDFIGLTFRKNMLKEDYDKVLEYVKKKVTI